MALFVLVLIISALAGFAIGRWLAVPLPSVVVWIWDWTGGPHNPDDDLRPIFNALLIVFATVGIVIGILTRKLVKTYANPDSTLN